MSSLRTHKELMKAHKTHKSPLIICAESPELRRHLWGSAVFQHRSISLCSSPLSIYWLRPLRLMLSEATLIWPCAVSELSDSEAPLREACPVWAVRGWFTLKGIQYVRRCLLRAAESYTCVNDLSLLISCFLKVSKPAAALKFTSRAWLL